MKYEKKLELTTGIFDLEHLLYYLSSYFEISNIYSQLKQLNSPLLMLTNIISSDYFSWLINVKIP